MFVDIPAHVIAPHTLDYLAEFVGPEEWSRSKTQMTALAAFAHPHGGGGSYYVLFPDLPKKTCEFVIGANTLYAMFDTRYFNEELLIVTTKP